MLSEVPISWSSMNHGDTFVLDSGELIFVWRGRCSSGAEALTAAKLATRLKNKMGEQVQGVLIDLLFIVHIYIQAYAIVYA